MDYIKHFGENSSEYLKFRPSYPEELYQYLMSIVFQHELAWDVGTGNGQAALQTARFFKKVIATDINHEQLKVATKADNIVYQTSAAEHTHLLNNSVDLITVAQALHWFNLEAFYREVKRVSKNTGIIAVWCYTLCRITTEIDQCVKILYNDILDNYFPKERKYVDDEYRTLPFPFKKITTPNFFIEKEYDFNEFIGYLNTWSGVKEYQKINQSNPLDLITNDLKKTWGSVEQKYKIHWPIVLLVGKCFS